MDNVYGNKILQEENISKPYLLLKENIASRYETEFLKENKFIASQSDLCSFDKQFSVLFTNEEHDKLIENMEKIVREKGNIFVNYNFSVFTDSQLPDKFKKEFAAFSYEDMRKNVQIISRFQDSGQSLLNNIFDKIIIESERYRTEISNQTEDDGLIF